MNRVHTVYSLITSTNDSHTFKACIVGGVETISRPDEIRQIAWIRLEEADALMSFYKERLQEIISKNVQVSYFDEGII